MSTAVLVTLTMLGLLVGLIIGYLGRKRRLPPTSVRLVLVAIISMVSLLLLYAAIFGLDFHP